MRRLIWEFLNTKYNGIVIYHQVYEFNNRRTEKFVSNSFESIIEFTYFYSGKDIRTHITPTIRRGIRNYFDINPLDVEGYILEWCRDKSIKIVNV
jgi:hypothetical protein